MRLDRKDRTKIAKENYWKNREALKEQAKKGSRPPITGEQTRQSSGGKGDGDRTKYTARFRKNYSRIKWKSSGNKKGK